MSRPWLLAALPASLALVPQETPAPAAPAAAPAAQESAPAAAPARGPGYESVVAADTMLFVGIDHLDDLLAEWRASPFGRLVGDEAAAPVRESFAALLAALADDSREELGVDLVEMVAKLDGRLAFAVGGDLMANGSDGHGVAAFESTGHAPELRALLATALEKMVEAGEAVAKHDKVGEHDLMQITPLGTADQGRFQMAQAGSTLALGTAVGKALEREDFAAFVQSLDGAGGEALGAQQGFRDSLAARSGGVKFFFDTGRQIRAAQSPPLEDGSESPDTQLHRTLGLDRFGPLGAHFALDADGMRMQVRQAWGEGGLAAVLQALVVGGPHELFKLLPVDAAVAIGLQLDLKAGLDAADALAKEAGMGSLFGEPVPEGNDPAAAAQDEFQPRRDLLDHLDGRLAFTAIATEPEESFMGMGAGGSASVNFALLLGTSNSAALGASIDKLLRSRGMHAARRKSEFEGQLVYSLPMGPVTIHYAIVEDAMITSPSLPILQDLLRRRSNSELANLHGSELFARQRAGLGGVPGLLVWSANSPELFDSLGGAATQQIEGGGSDESGYYDEEEDAYGDESDEQDAGSADEPPTQSPVEQRALAFVEAFAAIDNALLKKHLPGGAVMALRFDAGGAWLEYVSR